MKWFCFGGTIHLLDIKLAELLIQMALIWLLISNTECKSSQCTMNKVDYSVSHLLRPYFELFTQSVLLFLWLMTSIILSFHLHKVNCDLRKRSFKTEWQIQLNTLKSCCVHLIIKHDVHIHVKDLSKYNYNMFFVHQLICRHP